MFKNLLLLFVAFIASVVLGRYWWREPLMLMRSNHSSIYQGCGFDPPLSLPAGTQLYLALAGGGGIPFDSSGNPGGLPLQKMDVVVNLPEGDVALLFIGGSEETAWQIGWTEGTRLQAVALVKLPGGGRQVLAGIPPHVPTFVPSDGPGTCADLQSFSHFPSLIPGGEDFSGGEDFKWDQVFDAAAKLFGVRATAVFTFNKGGSSIVAGRPLKGSERIVTASPPPEAFVDKTLLSKDRLALEESVEEGILAYPTHEDARAWLESAGLLTPSPDVEGPTSSKGRLTLPWGRLYTVRRPYSIPKGVEGGIGLIVPRGVATPSGVVEGGIEIFDVASGTCRGDGKCYELTGGKKTMEAEKNE